MAGRRCGWRASGNAQGALSSILGSLLPRGDLVRIIVCLTSTLLLCLFIFASRALVVLNGDMNWVLLSRGSGRRHGRLVNVAFV
jgi:hypothetical protein